MNRVWWGALAGLFVLLIASHTVAAIDTVPSSQSPVKVNGPILITGYSFSGHSLRYLQLFNSSSDVVSLSGWKISGEYGNSQVQYAVLSGKLAPGKYVTIANTSTMPSATFTFVDAVAASDPVFASISLTPPNELNYNAEQALPSIVTSTPRVAGSPPTFYFSRNSSTSTGNFLTTFTAFVPTSTFVVVSDGVYVPPATPLGIKLFELFSDSSACAPNATDARCADYVKVYNSSVTPVDLSLYRLRTGSLGQAASSSNTAALSGVLQPGNYASFPLSLSSSGSWAWLEDRYGTVRYDDSVVQYPSNSANADQAWSYDAVHEQWAWTPLLSPGNQVNRFPALAEVNSCSGLRINEVAANVASEDQFIELLNPTTSNMDLKGCAVQTNRSKTTSYVFGDETLPANGLRVLYIKDTLLTLTKTTTGTVYILSSDLQNEVDAVSYENLDEDTSWSNVDGTWKQTYATTPNDGNVWMEFPACNTGYIRNTETGQCNKVQTSSLSSLAECEEGKYRNPETNRCKTLESLPTTTGCDAGQYRNPETNRCRSLATTTSLLAPCASNQERNPETNRCRLITSTQSEVKPCASNQERNPTTNRCRNKAGSSVSDFPVQAVAQTGEASIGWWAFGGAGTLAAGYAGWEWRREVSSIIKKAALFATGKS